MVETNFLNWLIPLLGIAMPVYGLYLLYKTLQELRAVRNSIDELRTALTRDPHA